MRKIVAFTALAAGLGFATPALADHHTVNAEVTQRDANGRATMVRVDGREYAVCTAQRQDGCINPREAGLNFGNVPLDHWPGRPASEGRRGRRG